MLAMDKAGREREMIAVLFDSLHVRNVLTSEQISEGFGSLLASLEDLLLDIPEAPVLLAHFLADAILDQLLPSNVGTTWSPELVASPTVRNVLDEVTTRLRGRVAVVSAQELRGSLRSIMSEYLASHDHLEVERRLEELKVAPELQHEILRASVEIALDRKAHYPHAFAFLLSSSSLPFGLGRMSPTPRLKFQPQTSLPNVSQPTYPLWLGASLYPV
jgi:programmed cell death protein 4